MKIHPGRIIYLHGFASGPTSQKAAFFRDRFERLGIELETPDLVREDFEHLTLSSQLSVLEQLAGDERVDLIGSSMGGYLAALYAARHPQVRKLVLLAPAFGFARRWPEVLGPEGLDQWRRQGTLNVYHYGERRMRKVGFQLFQDALTYEDYPQVTQPVLILHGNYDTTVPPRYSIEFASTRSQVRLTLLNSDHQLLDVLPQIWNEASQMLLEDS